ncbi:DJ-1/PfpI family protein [Paenibacillus sp. MER TA 81-3]|uniref:DJ-1/PfpI family protein n=1 Tax=Paenibacillus sp. MER TA 81-3 TaxID=2939573 RepID=UPI00203B6C72|nr:DJ-1/PfpI family protein [Paenibacillus sp. MER TA 81-3]MCM3342075.1 DJ-1/PfpI family protein [Paenibacillus sp. MER TA 81-3]
MKKQYNVGILVYDFIDILDFAGPSEVLSLTAFSNFQQNIMLYKRNLPKGKPFLVKTVSETGNTIKTHTGTVIHSDYNLNNAPQFDILIIPGGPLRAINKVRKNKKIIDYIVQSKNIEMICTVCTGSLILAETGLLDGKVATTHHLALSLLNQKSTGIQVVKDKKVVKDGNIITSGGVSSGINMALYLIEKLINKETALRTAKILEFNSYLESETMDVMDKINL